MPFIDSPSRGLRMFYVVNPLDPSALSVTLPTPESGALVPSKPILVMIHSASSSLACFSAQFSDPRLREAFNLVAFDARLHGRTTAEDVPSFTIEDQADELIEALDYLDLPSYSVFGEGASGSNSAAWIAIKRPSKVICISLASPSWMVDPPELSDSFRSLPEWVCINKDGNGDGTGEVPEEAVTALEDYFVGVQERVQDRRISHANALKFRYGAGKPSHDARHIMRWGYERQRIPQEQLATIAVPVLLLQGSADTIASPLAAVEEWQKSLTGVPGGADLRQITDAPHLLSWTDANVVNRMLVGFVTKSTEDRKV